MSVRAKMKLDSIETHSWKDDDGTPTRTLKFYTDPSLPEDQRFCKATPNGTINMLVTNPGALEQFELGKSYYVDFTPAPEPEKSA